MKLLTAFKTAWRDLKSALTKADSFLAKEEPVIQTVVTTGSAIVDAAVPAITPVVTGFDKIEEALMAEAVAAIHTGAATVNASTPQAAITFSTEMSAVLKSIVQTLEGHPAVVAAATPAPSAA